VGATIALLSGLKLAYRRNSFIGQFTFEDEETLTDFTLRLQ
jgi:hypothetical protein